MTNLEALRSLVHIEIPNLHEKVLLDNGVNPTQDYTSGNQSIIELCSAYVYKVELTHPDFSEGNLSISVKVDDLKKLMNSIFAKHNLTDEIVEAKPTIKFDSL